MLLTIDQLVFMRCRCRLNPHGVVYVADHVLIDAETLVEKGKILSIETLLEEAIIERG
jgi:hypothetical protein